MFRKFVLRDLNRVRDRLDASARADAAGILSEAPIGGTSRLVERRFVEGRDRRRGAERRSDRLGHRGRRRSDDCQAIEVSQSLQPVRSPVLGCRNDTCATSMSPTASTMSRQPFEGRSMAAHRTDTAQHSRPSQDLPAPEPRRLRGANLAFATQVLNQFLPDEDAMIRQRARRAYAQTPGSATFRSDPC